MPNQIITNARMFLDRIDLKGAEVPAFIEVRQMLDEIEKTLDTPPPPTADTGVK